MKKVLFLILSIFLVFPVFAGIKYADATVEGSVQRKQSNVNELYNKAENLDTDWENEYNQFVRNSETYRNWMGGENSQKLNYASQAEKWKRLLEDIEKEIVDINEQIKEVKEIEKTIHDQENLSKYNEYMKKLKGALLIAEMQQIKAESRIEHFELMAKKQDEIIERNKLYKNEI